VQLKSKLRFAAYKSFSTRIGSEEGLTDTRKYRFFEIRKLIVHMKSPIQLMDYKFRIKFHKNIYNIKNLFLMSFTYILLINRNYH